MSYPIHIAYFISPHGFGHGARAAAVIKALHEQNPFLHFEIFTTVPRWFVRESCPVPFTYHTWLVDIGLAQKSSLREDIPQTLHRLRQFLPLDQDLISNLAALVRRLKCRLVVSDIAPLGIAAARAAGIPSVLVENFTWDWIYRGYERENKRFREYADYLSPIFRSADSHIQTEPVCHYGHADLVTPPISRASRSTPNEVRASLDIPRRAKTVLITMGGIPERHKFLERLTKVKHVRFIVPGASDSECHRENLILLPHRSRFYHPDLMNAADAVIGKAGYSTVAEAYHAGIPLGYIQRDRFRESQVMARFIAKAMTGFELPALEFESGEWISRLPDILSIPRIKVGRPNGAVQAANLIAKTLDGA